MTADELEKIQNGLTPEATKAASTFSQKCGLALRK
jgi:hypothetical protein